MHAGFSCRLVDAGMIALTDAGQSHVWVTRVGLLLIVCALMLKMNVRSMAI